MHWQKVFSSVLERHREVVSAVRDCSCTVAISSSTARHLNRDRSNTETFGWSKQILLSVSLLKLLEVAIGQRNLQIAVQACLRFMVTALLTYVKPYDRLLLIVISTSSNVVGLIVLVLVLVMLTGYWLSLITLS